MIITCRDGMEGQNERVYMKKTEKNLLKPDFYVISDSVIESKEGLLS